MVRRAAFSMVEVLVAFAVLGIAMLPVLALFSSAGDQARQTSDHALATVLDERVAEELRTEAWENVHFADRFTDPALAGRKGVVDGGSPFFATVEDDAAPYGRIDVNVDHPVIESMGALYPELKSFKLGMTAARRSLPATGVVHDLELDVEWTDYQRKQREMDLRVTVGAYHAVTFVEPVPLDRNAADAAIAKSFYNGAASLSTAVAAAGADLAAVRNLGDVGVLLNASRAADDAWAQQVNQLAVTAATGTGAEAARAQLILARHLESHLLSGLENMQYLCRPLEDLSRTFARAQLGNPPIPDPAYRGSLIAAAWYPYEQGNTLFGTMQAYARAYNDPLGKALPPRTRIRAFMKTLELAKLMALTCGPPDVTYVRALLTDFRRHMDGHNPSFVRFADAELARSTDLATLRQTYSVPARASIWARYLAAVVPAVTRVFTAP